MIHRHPCAFIRAALATIVLLVAFGTLVAHADEEQILIDLLRSDAPAPQRADACQRLRIVGTARSVPALATLLPDPRLSHAARHALEGMPFPEATRALRAALPTSTGAIQAGIIDSLGWRRESTAVPALTQLVAHPDPIIASAAATALGRIATPEAQRALTAARLRAPSDVQSSVLSGLLLLADQYLADGHPELVEPVFDSLARPSEAENVRLAAFTGLIRVAGTQSLTVLTRLLGNADPVGQAAALKSAGSVAHPDLVPTLAQLLPRTPPAVQIGLLAVFHQRADPAALPAVLKAAESADDSVRSAALTALGTVGDVSAIPVLLRAAASRLPADQAAAHEALALVSHGPITAALLAGVQSAPADQQREIFRALAARADPEAIPPLLELARSESAPLRLAALQTLGGLARPEDLGALVRLLMQAANPADQEDVRGVFETLVERYPDPGALTPAPITQALATAAAPTRTAILPVAALFADEGIRDQFRRALADPEPSVREAAQRALCATRDSGLLPEILLVAQQATANGLRTLALEGLVRLATDDSRDALPAGQRAETLVAALAVASRAQPQDRRTVLSGLTHVPHPTSLQAAELTRSDPDPQVRAQAEFATLQIARSLAPTHSQLAVTSLTQLATTSTNPAIQTNAQALLNSLNSGWLCCGPYRISGKQAQDLFDVSFPPEVFTPTPPIDWRRAPGIPDLSRPGEIDLGPTAGGDHAVVYARTRIQSRGARAVVLAIGSDDGIKLWLNGSLVHANNAVRGLTPGQDRVPVTLRDGTNELLAKITQHTAGCGLSLRILDTQGNDIPDLRPEFRNGPP